MEVSPLDSLRKTVSVGPKRALTRRQRMIVRSDLSVGLRVRRRRTVHHDLIGTIMEVKNDSVLVRWDDEEIIRVMDIENDAVDRWEIEK
jgi:hypothetical protein